MPVAALDPTFINAPGGVGPSYDAEELRRNIGGMLSSSSVGVARSGVLNRNSTVLALSGSNVQATPSSIVVGSTKGAYISGSTATVTIDALAAADVTNPRRDRVILRVYDPDNGTAGSTRLAQFEVLTGTPSPTALSGGGYPALPALSTQLGYVDVPKVGSGSPTLTVDAAWTTTVGSPIPFRNATEMNAHTVVDSLGLRLDTGAVMRRGASAWVPVTIDGGTVYGFVDIPDNYTYSGPVNVTALHDGRKRVDVAVSMVRANTNNPMSGTSQDMGVVLPAAAIGSANSICGACPLDNGVDGNVSTTQVFWQISPSTGKLFIWAPTSYNWVPGRLITINCTYYI